MKAVTSVAPLALLLAGCSGNSGFLYDPNRLGFLLIVVGIGFGVAAVAGAENGAALILAIILIAAGLLFLGNRLL